MIVLKEPFLGWWSSCEGHLKSLWTGSSVPLLCRGRHNTSMFPYMYLWSIICCEILMIGLTFMTLKCAYEMIFKDSKQQSFLPVFGHGLEGFW